MDNASQNYIAAITKHSSGLADAAEGNLDAAVQHCPGWNVADLVHHLTTTHWFWGTIVEERLSAPPEETRRPARVKREQLIDACRESADRLVRVLSAADGADPVYTWAPTQRNVAFVTRHQVQEAAVHHWDAVHAARGDLTIAAPIADDAIEEFLTFSVSSLADPAEPARLPLAGELALRSTDSSAAWTIRDDVTPGTVRYERGLGPTTPVIDGTSSELLLWLYQRLDLTATPETPDLVDRFRALCFTD